MQAYLRDLGCHRVLSREEEHEVAVRYLETGDRRLADQLVNANLRLVVKIALEYRVSRRTLGDLVQEGNVGLVYAVRKYDPNRGIRFASYAVWWIRAFMLKFMLSDARLVKLGTTRAQRKLYFGMGRTRARLEAQSGGAADAAEIATALSVTEREVVEMAERLAGQDASLDAPAHDGDERVRLEMRGSGEPGADAVLEEAEVKRHVRRQMRAFGSGLTGRDRLIFRRRMLCETPATLSLLADDVGVTRERVRQLEVRLKERLRAHLEATLGEVVAQAA
jgi:RNA polymerase sigma-32 factor